MNVARWAVLLVGVVLALGCSKANPTLVGTWTTESERRGLPTETEATFHADGKYVSITNYLNEDKIEMQSTDTGTWKLNEGELTVKLTDVEWTFPDAADAKKKQAAELFKQNKAAIMASVNDAGPILVNWLGPDHIQCTVQEGTYEYRRKR